MSKTQHTLGRLEVRELGHDRLIPLVALVEFRNGGPSVITKGFSRSEAEQLAREHNSHDALVDALDRSATALDALATWIKQNCHGIDGASVMLAMIETQRAENGKAMNKAVKGE